MLSAAQLTQAACVPVVRENGLRIQFGELWRMQRTVVLFIRHFWCPMCQDYLASLMRDVDHAALARSGVRLVVIGCGSHGLIRSYRQIFHLPYELFVDASPGQTLYRTLGMGRVPSGSQRARSSTEHPVGSYVRHGAVSGLAMVVAHALRVGMPVWERGGDASQLGGEFVLGPGLTCTYVHRMPNTAGHAPIVDVLAAAGVRAARSDPGGQGTVAARTMRPSISSPFMHGAGRRDTKALSVVREEACGSCGACEALCRGSKHRFGIYCLGRMERGCDGPSSLKFFSIGCSGRVSLYR
ncbi:hypothetical protein F5148DRAFT_979798 [Russula earlei]|uniref:Uncharacterized protein n=1 Tax=Russula earlei TaxID=71964 RepID=A0ACC0U9Z4_9AGAM|nr:hypothetical protein F5148DRAFT_979798 [Russula earlei]